MTTITWSIRDLERDVNTGGVVKVQWRCTAQGETRSTNIVGTVDLQPDSTSNSFIPFDQLTEETVINWVLSVPGLQQDTEDLATRKVSDIASPTLENGMPW
jgi:hypothetical protein